jgi:hypothetical protein
MASVDRLIAAINRKLDRRGNTWLQADVACRAIGKRLPTSAEWGIAARGPSIRDRAMVPAECVAR